MERALTLLGGFVALLGVLAVGWKRWGHSASDASYNKAKYAEAKRVVYKMLQPIPASDELRSRANAALRKRMRDRS